MLRAAAQAPDRVPVYFSGVSALAEVTAYHYQAPSRRSPHLCACPADYYGDEEIDWRLLDLSGAPAPDLESELSARDRAGITSALLARAAHFRQHGEDL